MILTYSGVLSAIEKALWELMEEYQRVRKSLWDLVESQERNTAQLKRIEVTMEQRWGSEEESGNGDEEEESEDGPGESQEGGLRHPSLVSILVLFFLF